MKNLEVINERIFEDIKLVDENGYEYWYARELMSILNYKRWDKFMNVIVKAQESCKNSNIKIDEHFSHVGKMISLPKGARRNVEDYKLSRYACYLIAQNGDSRKEVIALAQTYFVIQTSNLVIWGMKMKKKNLLDNFLQAIYIFLIKMIKNCKK